ncbi:hypothetical protein MAR_002911 [Mya arenaria]|uniref:Uncharacterized protein n=1 Tax=Mya arenaria TaxID=6604 RepID=A0ABY7G4H0_MYAAR|nr:hypothetical protein MAR_002911 [Mya arenaria]
MTSLAAGSSLLDTFSDLFGLTSLVASAARRFQRLITNQQLVDRYRFNRAGLNYLETVFGPALEPATMRHET